MNLRNLPLAFAMAAILAGCQTGAQQAQNGVASPLIQDQPGTTVRIKNIDSTRWDGQRRGDATVFNCKPLACVAPSAVAFLTRRSPTRNPDPIALAKIAKLAPAQVQSQNVMAMAGSEGTVKLESLSSRVATLRGFPAIVTEQRRLVLGRPVSFLQKANMFVGNIEVQVSSISQDRDAAKRNMAAFIEGLDIADLPPS